MTRCFWDGGRQSSLGVAMYLWLLQLADLKDRTVFLTALSSELPAEHRMSVLLLRSARRASSDHIRLVTTSAVRYSVTSKLRLLLASLRSVE